MFGRSRSGRERPSQPVPVRGSAAGRHRHGRRPIRSSLTGPSLPDPDARVVRFEIEARAALEVLQAAFPDELRGVRFAYATAPSGQGDSEHPQFYAIDRRARSIVLFRMPIQRARGLHIDDEEHRALFVGRCVYLAVCEYLGQDPWDLLPGRFEHF